MSTTSRLLGRVMFVLLVGSGGNPRQRAWGAIRLGLDWADITIEPRHAAVAMYRHFLAIHPGGDTPDTFLRAYERWTGHHLL